MANAPCQRLWVRSGRLSSALLMQLGHRRYGAEIAAVDIRQGMTGFIASCYRLNGSYEEHANNHHSYPPLAHHSHCHSGAVVASPASLCSRIGMIKGQQSVISGGTSYGGVNSSVSCRQFHPSASSSDVAGSGNGEMDGVADVTGTRVAWKVAPLPADIIVSQEEPQGEGEGAGTSKQRIPLPRLVRPPAGVRQGAKPESVSLQEAIRSVKANAKAKFDETVEAHICLSVDPRRGDQLVRGSAVLPHGVGKVVRVAVFAEGEKAEEAMSSGADVVGANDLIALVKNSSGGKLPFDRCIATPSMMPRLGQVGRILGPRGLMPNPKVGTVTNDVAAAVRAAKFGQVEFRADKGAIVHAGVGKVSFPEERLLDNVAAFSAALLKAKPVGLKGSSKYLGYFTSFALSSTMGPGIKVDVPSVAAAADSYVRQIEQNPNSGK